MRSSLLTRAAALVVAAVFLGGVAGVSDLDALLFHRTGAPVAAGVAHLETANSGGCHADRCVLALRLTSGRQAPMPSLPVRFEAMPQHDAVSPPPAAPCRSDGVFTQLSRAPPAPLA